MDKGVSINQDGNPVMMAPSILSADFLNLESSINLVADRCDYIHVDVMDGHFVPNLTLGAPFVKALKGRFSTPLDVHLMVSNPEDTIDWYLDAGADIATFQLEAVTHANRLVQHIRERGSMAGVAANPATPICLLRDLVEVADLILVMSVNPGFGGQRYLPTATERLRRLKAMRDRLNPACLIVVDGGINRDTVAEARRAGADVAVAGSALFNDKPVAENLKALRLALLG